MSTHLANHICARMNAKNLSVAGLEREAGLPSHAVRNILRGKSKRPSADVLIAIAGVLGCTVEDLMTKHDMLGTTGYSGDKQKILNEEYKPSNVMEETVRVVNHKINTENKTLTLKQLLTCVEAVYIHSLHHGKHVNDDYVEWYMGQLQECNKS